MRPLWIAEALLPTGWAAQVRLEIRAGVIATMAVGAEPRAGDETIDIAVAGCGNLHSHAFQRAMAGLAETAKGDDFWGWREVMYRLVGRIEPEDLQAIAAQAFVEMLEAGFTRAGEFHYLHNDRHGARYADPGEMAARIVAAADQTGIGLTLLPVLYAHSGFGGRPPEPAQMRFISDVDGFGQIVERYRALVRTLPDAVVGVAPHSLRAVTPDELAAAHALAGEGPVHIHVAEQTAEVEACLAWSGARPVEWLIDHMPVDARWCLVHATHVAGDELARVAAAGATVGLCPITEANLGDGLFPVEPFCREGGAFGVGTDSNVRIDLTEELRLLEYGQRLARHSRGVAGSGAELFRRAGAGAARALGVKHGGLEVGAPADIVALRADHPSLCARTGDLLLDGWIFSAGGEAVDRVWRRGVRLVENGRHVKREEVAARYRQTLAALSSR